MPLVPAVAVAVVELELEVEDTHLVLAHGELAAEEAAVEAVQLAAAAALLSQDSQALQDLPAHREAMASQEDQDSQDRTLSQHHSKPSNSRATAAASQPATDPQAHQDLQARTETQEHQDRTHKAEAKDHQDHPDHPDPTASQEGQANPADLDSPDKCTRLLEERGHLDLPDPMASPADLDNQETMARLDSPDSLARQETLEDLDRQETQGAPDSPEEMASQEERVDATTAHHPALPQDTKQELDGTRRSQSNDEDASSRESNDPFISYQHTAKFTNLIPTLYSSLILYGSLASGVGRAVAKMRT